MRTAHLPDWDDGGRSSVLMIAGGSALATGLATVARANRDWEGSAGFFNRARRPGRRRLSENGRVSEWGWATPSPAGGGRPKVYMCLQCREMMSVISCTGRGDGERACGRRKYPPQHDDPAGGAVRGIGQGPEDLVRSAGAWRRGKGNG